MARPPLTGASLRTSALRYRVMAYVTGVALVVLCFAGIPLQVAGHPAVASDVGVVHGILYIIYLVTVYLLSRNIRLEPRHLVIFVLAGIVPVMTFVVERWAARRFINPALAAPGRTAETVRLVSEPAHYFSPRPEAPHRPGLVRVILPDVYLELETDAGVFSPGRLDPGTRLLLDAAPAPPETGDLLDLGCGYGPVACVLAARSPGATVWAVDVNERALELCARNAASAGLPNVRCVTPGDGPARVDAIWSNPPVRIGKQRLHELLRMWLSRLDGPACLVVGRNLGADSLARWLAGEGWPATRLAARSGYRLLQVKTMNSERSVVLPP